MVARVVELTTRTMMTTTATTTSSLIRLVASVRARSSLVYGDEVADGTQLNGDTPADSTYDNTVDFGISRGLSLGNRIWLDTNNDGIRDASELGVDGVTVILYSVATGLPVDTFITQDGGYYLFTLIVPRGLLCVTSEGEL